MSPRATLDSVAGKMWPASCGSGWSAVVCILIIQMDQDVRERSLGVTLLTTALFCPGCVFKPHSWFSLLEQWEFHGRWPVCVFITLSFALEVKSVTKATLDEICMILPFGQGTFIFSFPKQKYED
jgi:hypothetical protein